MEFILLNLSERIDSMVFFIYGCFLIKYHLAAAANAASAPNMPNNTGEFAASGPIRMRITARATTKITATAMSRTSRNHHFLLCSM